MKCYNHYITAIISLLVVLFIISIGMSCCSTLPKSNPEKPQKFELKSSKSFGDSIVISRNDLDSVINMFNKNLVDIEERNSEVVQQQMKSFGSYISLWLAFIAAICTLLPMASAFYQATNTSKSLEDFKTDIERTKSEFQEKIKEEMTKSENKIKESEDKFDAQVAKTEEKIKECDNKITGGIAKCKTTIEEYEKRAEQKAKITPLLGTLVQSIRLLCDMEDFRFKDKIALADKEYIENLIYSIDKLNEVTKNVFGKIDGNLDEENQTVITCSIVVGYRSLLNLLHVMESIVPDDKIIDVLGNKDIVIIDSQKFVSNIAKEQNNKIDIMKDTIKDFTILSSKILFMLRDCFNFKKV